MKERQAIFYLYWLLMSCPVLKKTIFSTNINNNQKCIEMSENQHKKGTYIVHKYTKSITLKSKFLLLMDQFMKKLFIQQFP